VTQKGRRDHAGHEFTWCGTQAAPGPVPEGNVGGGTGMVCHGFKGGIAATRAANVAMLPNDSLNPVFEAAVQATEEAIVNAMVGAETMTGVDGHTVTALPHDRLREVLKKYNRLQVNP